MGDGLDLRNVRCGARLLGRRRSMRPILAPVLSGLLLLSSVAASAAQGSSESVPAVSQSRAVGGSTTPGVGDCSGALESLRSAQQAVDRDRRPFSFAPASEGPNAATNENVSQDNLRQDLIFLDQKTAEYTSCSASNNSDNAVQDPPSGCTSESLLNFPVNHHGEPEGEIPIWHVPGSSPFFYEAGDDN